MRNRRMIFYGTAVAILLATAYWGWKITARAAYESADYAVIVTDGEFEIREYPSLTMATTTMSFAAQGNDGSFGRLFRYISGANDAKQKVAMTTPVFMQPYESSADGQMGFVIPKGITDKAIPQPTADGVAITERKGGRFAVVRFAGRFNAQRFAEQESVLRQWMESNDLAGDSDAEFAGYDPPWTPGPFRRNEVLIRID